MLTEEQAKNIVLEMVNKPTQGQEIDEFAISSATLSEKKDYWIVRANSKDYLEHGDASKLYVGVNAYMVNSESGEIEIVGSAQSTDNFLTDKYDLMSANGSHYVLACDILPSDNSGIIKLHQVFNCTLKQAKIIINQKRNWFTGKKRHLLEAKSLLEDKGVKTKIFLTNEPKSLAKIESEIVWWETLENIITNEIIT